MSTPTIRTARPDDLPAVRAIYNHYVLTSTCTFRVEPETEDERLAWFEDGRTISIASRARAPS